MDKSKNNIENVNTDKNDNNVVSDLLVGMTERFKYCKATPKQVPSFWSALMTENNPETDDKVVKSSAENQIGNEERSEKTKKEESSKKTIQSEPSKVSKESSSETKMTEAASESGKEEVVVQSSSSVDRLDLSQVGEEESAKKSESFSLLNMLRKISMTTSDMSRYAKRFGI